MDLYFLDKTFKLFRKSGAAVISKFIEQLVYRISFQFSFPYLFTSSRPLQIRVVKCLPP